MPIIKMDIEARIKALENTVYKARPSSYQTMRILENIIERVCAERMLPLKMELSDFIDWLRSLYPELYVELEAQDNNAIHSDGENEAIEAAERYGDMDPRLYGETI